MINPGETMDGEITCQKIKAKDGKPIVTITGYRKKLEALPQNMTRLWVPAFASPAQQCLES